MISLNSNSEIVRKNLIDEEISKINEHFAKFGFKFRIDSFAKLFYNDAFNYPGTLIKNINLIIRILTLANFTSEEAIEFLIHNKKFMIEDINELHLKFAILNSAGMLEDVLRTNPNIILKLDSLKAERLFPLIVYAKSKGKNLNLETIVSPNITIRDMNDLVDFQTINSTINNLLNGNLDKDLELHEYKQSNSNKLKR